MTSRFLASETGMSLPTTSRRGPRPRVQESDDLFAAPVLETPTRLIRGSVRETDGITSQRAAVDTLPKRRWIQEAIMAALATQGPLNDAELENRAEFDGLAPSTVRKRRSELLHAIPPRIVEVGRRDKMTLWDVAP